MSARAADEHRAPPTPEPARPVGWRAWHRQRWFGPAIGLLFLAIVGWLVADHVKVIDWGLVRASITAFRLPTLAWAGLLAVLSHLTYASYELIGRRYVGH